MKISSCDVVRRLVVLRHTASQVGLLSVFLLMLLYLVLAYGVCRDADTFEVYKSFTAKNCRILNNVDVKARGSTWWQNVSAAHNHTYVFSAFFDVREGDFGVIRVLGSAWHAQQAVGFCQFYYTAKNKNKVVPVKKVSTITDTKRWRYEPVQIVCILPDKHIPDFVSVVIESCDVPSNVLPVYRSSYHTDMTTSNFGLCVETPLFGIYHIDRLIETFEVYRMFGVTKIILYVYSDIILLEELKDYVDRGVLEIIEWNIPRIVKESIHYYGQQVSMNDCLYRLMSKVKYIVVSDFDEIIVPRQTSNYSAMLSQFPSQTNRMKNVVFYFRNSFFPIHFGNLGTKLFVLNSTLRQAPLKENRQKFIIEARFVEYIGVHIVFKTMDYVTSLRVVPSRGLLHHYRQIDEDAKGLTVTNDTYMLQFKEEIVKRINEVKRHRST